MFLSYTLDVDGSTKYPSSVGIYISLKHGSYTISPSKVKYPYKLSFSIHI